MPSDFHARGTMVLSCALMLLGVAIIARTIDAGGGVFSIGIVVGVLFLAAGAGRLWVAVRGERE